MMENATLSRNEPASRERPLPKYIRRSLLRLSIDDPQLADKAHASWADAIILDFTRAQGRDWQADLRIAECRRRFMRRHGALRKCS